MSLSSPPEKLPDWSSRHVRLRFELIVVSLVCYLFEAYHVPLQTSLLLPINLTNVPTEHVVITLFALFIYLAISFAVRTRAEFVEISSYSAAINASIEGISTNYSKLSTLLESFELEEVNRLVSEYVTDLREMGKQINPIPQSDLDHFSLILTRQMDSANKNPDDEDYGVYKEFRRLSASLESAKEFLATYEISSRQFDEIARRLEALSSVGLKEEVDAIRESLDIRFTQLESLRRQLVGGRNAFSLDRVFIGVIIPAYVSGTLFVAALVKHILN